MARVAKSIGTNGDALARAEALRARAGREFEAGKWVITDLRVKQALRHLNRSAALAKEAVVEAQRWFMQRIGLRPQEELTWTDYSDIREVIPWEDDEPTSLKAALGRLLEAAGDVLRHDSWKPIVRVPPRFAGRIVASDTRIVIDGFKRFARLDPDSPEFRTLVRAIRIFASEAATDGEETDCETCASEEPPRPARGRGSIEDPDPEPASRRPAGRGVRSCHPRRVQSGKTQARDRRKESSR